MAKSAKHFCINANLYCYDEHCGGCEYYEKSIVKPYLEKLESKLLDCCDPRIRTETKIPIKKVLDLIDSLLTEKGAEE